MSEMEKKAVNEMDAAELVTAAQEADRQRVVPVAEENTQERDEGRTTEDWAVEVIREFDDGAKRWHHRKGWEAFGLACFHGLSVMACCAAPLGNYWQLVLVGMLCANLLMAGGWIHAAKAGWSV